MAGSNCCNKRIVGRNVVPSSEYNQLIEIQKVQNQHSNNEMQEARTFTTIETAMARVKTKRTQISVEGISLGGLVDFYIRWNATLNISLATHILCGGDRYEVVGSPFSLGVDMLKQEFLFTAQILGNKDLLINN